MYANINSNFNYIRLDLDRLLWTVCTSLWHCYLLSLLVFPHDIGAMNWTWGRRKIWIRNQCKHTFTCMILIFCYIVHLLKQWKEFNMLKKWKRKKSTQISSDKKQNTIHRINSTKNNNVQYKLCRLRPLVQNDEI